MGTSSSTVLLALAVISISYIVTESEAKSQGCTAQNLLPNRPYFVVWNHPTTQCEKKGIHLNFEKWGIIDNNNDVFVGEQISLMYTLGNWPYFYQTSTHNGGIPQLGNLTGHLAKVQSDIKTQIPNAAFSGLGVIDFENWRPLFDLNFDRLKIYQEKSIELAHQKFPNYNSSQLKQEAQYEFESAARSFIGRTLESVLSLRPGGRWGYYGYPRCWDNYCNDSTVRINDNMSWIYNISRGLYPSNYFDLKVSPKARARFVQQNIHETLRVKGKWAPLDADILPYALNQNGPYSLFTPMDLSYSILQPANMGSSGVVLWGSSSLMQAKNECLVLQGYIESTLGPYSLAVSNFFSNCTQHLCHAHGRCVKKEYEAVYQYHLRESGRTKCLIPEERLLNRKSRKLLLPSHQNYIKEFQVENSSDEIKGSQTEFASKLKLDEDYVCKCFAGWSGPYCDHKSEE